MKRGANDATKIVEKEQLSSEDEDSDSMSDQSSSVSEGARKSQKSKTQFSVLRNDTDGLRMKISAIRNSTNISDYKKCSTGDNNNLDTIKLKKESKKSSKKQSKKEKNMSSIPASSSCCSVCSRSENESNSEAKVIGKDKARKTKLKRKKTNKNAFSDSTVKNTNSSDSESENCSKTKAINDLSDNQIKKPLGNLNNPVLPLPDNSCLSSSDNDLPALVSAAIKCVESGSESDKCPLDEAPKNQYTSSLLQDFMVKTQMLGQNFTTNKTSTLEKLELSETSNSTLSKKRRGRPKKSIASLQVLLQPVNESADSGITSTAQSSSPSPKNPITKKISAKFEKEISQSPREILPKAPKIDMVSLDKRMYATERVLYPPPRNKRKASSISGKNLKAKTPKDDALDPIWRKIDVNTKFRRPSLSGYKSDGGNTVCSKVLAAKSGYVSDYGSVYAKNYHSGYKSDASYKSRGSMRSCISRAKSCYFRNECGSMKNRKFRRKPRSLMKHSKSVGNVNELDILQLAGLSLGQSSEESNEYVCKPLLPSTTPAKKLGEINRFVATGEYFGRSKTRNEPQTDDNQESSSLLGSKLFLKSSTRSQLTSADFSSELIDRLPRKIKSRRSSVASYCSSYYSGGSRRKRRRRRSFRYGSRSCTIDSKLSTEIEIIINSFAACRINCDKKDSSSKNDKFAGQKTQNKRNLKKRKLSENIDFAVNNVSVTKRRHKKACSSSPDDHKLPLKKRHYLLTPGEKSNEVKAALLLDAKAKELGDVKSSGKGSSASNSKVSTKAITPKKRHFLQTQSDENVNSHPMQAASSASDSKLLIKALENAVGVKGSEIVNKKRHRLEGLVSKIANNSDIVTPSTVVKEQPSTSVDLEPSYPPPGVFEPSIELEIQIPLAKLTENAIITKSEVDSPLDLLDLNKTYPEPAAKTERVVETLLNRTGGNLLLKRKRKKINRTGFPTVKKKKRKIIVETESIKIPTGAQGITEKQQCDRVPQTGEASDTFLQRNKAPRLSVVSLERLQGPSKKDDTKSEQVTNTRRKSVAAAAAASVVASEKTSKRGANAPAATNKSTKVSKIEPKTQTNTRIVAPRNRSAGRESKAKKTENAKIQVEKPKIEKPVMPECTVRVKKKNLSAKTEEKPAKVVKLAATPTRTSKTSKKGDKPDVLESLEQDPLPDDESTIDYESTFSDTSDEKISGRKQKLKKSYLPAGLLSEYFKIPATRPKLKPGQGKENNTAITNLESSAGVQSILPAPPYCEKFFRRSVSDFLLPYDIWYAYTNSKLPVKHTVPSWNYKKIRTNIYTDAVRPNVTNSDHPTCNCKADIGCGDDCLNRMVYTECSVSTCPNREKCRNQKIQRHDVAPGVERFMTDNKGWGVMTKKPIQKGTYILEYVGEVVTEKEFKDRMASLYANDTHHYCLHLDGGLVIDGHRMGSDGRFVNHSCQPNCEMQKWSVNGLSRMALFAGRNIQPGEELTYDYNFALFNPAEGQPCRCNTEQCRGVIGGKSQRIKPLEPKPTEVSSSDGRNGRQRKRTAKKNSARLQSKDIVIPQLQPLSDKDKKIVKSSRCFLIRTLEKIRRLINKPLPIKCDSPGRPMTPSSLAVQMSALRVPRNIKTRGLTQAATDPELEKMAKLAVILKEICVALENVKDATEKCQILKILPTNKKKRNTPSSDKKNPKPTDFATIQANIEKGFYKEPTAFDDDIQNIFTYARKQFDADTENKQIIENLSKVYAEKKIEVSSRLLDIVDAKMLNNFCPSAAIKPCVNSDLSKINGSPGKNTEDIIRCICGLFKDEGLMIQCAKCMVWQHTECTKADVDADNYMCERCDSRIVDYEIPLEEFTDDGYRYYLSLMRGDLQIRQGDTVYVLRDIPIKDDSSGKGIKKHTYETIGEIDFSECDIFRVERLWKNNDGKRLIFGHHYLRPHETFHEPSRKFYPNEVVRVPLYEVVPIELVIARCWVLDRTTFCKGRPIDITSEEHVYINELRVDKTARFFSKAKQNYTTCTKNYAFNKFEEKLKIAKTYAPHDVDSAKLKTKKRKADEPAGTVSSVNLSATPPPIAAAKRNQQSCPVIQLLPPPQKTISERRSRLENVLKNIKIKYKNTQLNLPALDLSYLLSGRGARQRKAIAATVPT